MEEDDWWANKLLEEIPEEQKHFSQSLLDYVINEKANKFIEEFKELCKKHNLSIGHKDEYGAFIITDFDEKYIKWMEAALVK